MSYPATKQYRWPLSVDPFTLWDRLRLAAFVLNRSNRLTQCEQVKLYEQKMAKFIGCKFAVYASSGSAANTLLAMYVKDHTTRRVVAFPAVTWQTSCSPWIREGFTPRFFDVNIHDFSLNLTKLDEWLDVHAQECACVFVTSLLGFSPDLEKLDWLQGKHGVRIYTDNCESALTSFKSRNISSYFTSTISTYFAHHIQSIEGGFVLTDDEKLYHYCLMARNHGMVRGLKHPAFKLTLPIEEYRTPSISEEFDFSVMGSNFRNTEINAFLGQMDLLRAGSYINDRREQYEAFFKMIDPKFYVPRLKGEYEDVPFCLPIVPIYHQYKHKCLMACERLGIESRPLVAGNLLQHRAYREFYPQYYPTQDISKLETEKAKLSVADILHRNGFYVGIGNCTTLENVKHLATELNRIVGV